jgi:hypothetical protein
MPSRKHRQKSGYGDDADLDERSGPTPFPIVEAEDQTLDEEADDWVVRLARDLFRLKQENPGERIRYAEEPISDEEIKEALRTIRHRTPQQIAEDRKTVDAAMERVRRARARQAEQSEGDPDPER